MEFIVALTIGVAGSFVAAIVFLAFLHIIRPKIEISSHIARRTKGNDPQRLVYDIKIINKSRRPILDVVPKLQIVLVTHPPGGHSLMTIREIELANKHFFLVAGYKKSDESARYAVRFSTEENIDELWSDRRYSYLRFVIKGTDRWSGILDVFEKEFRGDDAIKTGSFKTGLSTEIIPPDQILKAQQGPAPEPPATSAT